MECSICENEIEKKINPTTKKVYWDEGNNAQPVNDGRCCDICNNSVVIPTRINIMKRGNKKWD